MFPIAKAALSFGEIADYWPREIHGDLSPLSHPPMSRALASFALRPFFGSPGAGVFQLVHDGGLAAPSQSSNVIGGFCPIAPCGRSSL